MISVAGRVAGLAIGLAHRDGIGVVGAAALLAAEGFKFLQGKIKEAEEARKLLSGRL
jgi:hypothetical protein